VIYINNEGISLPAKKPSLIDSFGTFKG